MTKAVQKITLSPSRDIPFNKLVLGQSNVRRVKAGVSIEQLAESIAQRTLLQGLSVRAVVDADGNETGMFEVPAGGRRYRALELLVKQKRMSKTQAVPCVVREGGIAEDDSVAENDERVGLHPLDQFRAFQTLRDLGMSEEDIAARHFVNPAIVKQRLRLASVSPKLHEVYAEDGMTLEQLMAFSVTADHARQEQVWENVSRSGYDEPYQIRRLLTENTVRGSDPRAQFVGLDAYQSAGGGVLRDLFEHDDGGWLQDVVLLDRLVTEKLKAEAETIAAEGWKWISVAVDFPYGHTQGLRQIEGKPVDLSPEEQATIDALNAEQAKLEVDYRDADELPDEVDQRLGEIESALAAFEDRPMLYEPAEIARAGVFISIDSEGRLAVDRGYVRPEDEVPATDPDVGQGADASSTEGLEVGPSVQRTVIAVAGGAADAEEDDEDATKPLPDRLIIELTAHRTLTLRDALAGNPAVAFQAVLHNFVLTAFYRFASSGSCLEISLRTPNFPAQAPGLRESVSAKAVEARHEVWKARLPKSENDLWDALTALDGGAQASLFAHCASFAVNAVHEPANRYNQGRVSAHGVRTRLDQADVLARAVGLDMVQAGWRPTVDNYLGRVTKPRILDAVRQAKGESSAQLIDHLKKADMAKEAERLLDGSGWLPEPLRLLDPDAASEQESEAGRLPEFLADEEDQETAADEDPQHLDAAE
ncbi:MULTISPECIES: ParB/RepB/Spo0J family partition protein [Nitrobacteraceae]|jgi:ParB family transcriptional regulator, chromosome partitioning protein|uniref:ParB-like partition protein n=3 Tax=Nitrobacteraceae TaxID=41294 RepID=K8PN47_9BRAD|nr:MULTISPECIES: ParB/RepB/Spo0J family partition protein [Nitrobacteraceae]MBB1093251.1 ParB N-terminal domain-containing protein [Rhodopseudomonas palustris]MBN9597361.1 ParB N-terminal domain-containing protein [Afipia sp.]MCI1271464.1 ParB N-terminal domain-containing protein [Sphingobium sp.]MDD1571352.1 DNA-binding protein [Bradyrhizobium sp. WBOS1]UUO34593.1 DNA-binding protein [Bradyrhizobium sp. WBOS01]HQZ13764.1 ParB N-terminal domain-containing protein [Devosia sp.]